MADQKPPAEPKTNKPEPAKAAPKQRAAAPPKETGAAKTAAKTAPKAAAPPKTTKAAAPPSKKAPEVKIVEKAEPKKHVARAKPQLSKELEARLRLRTAIDSRRPTFRRQQWYEYKKLEDSGWRRPTGVDSAMRRHFGYEQSVVRVGFRGPVETRGLHPSGFQEVFVNTVQDLSKIDPKTQAARVSGNLGTRKLKLVYAEADKLKIRVLNRRDLK